MSNGKLPGYLAEAKPNPMGNRLPWYKSTAPTFAGIFLWVVFYMEIPTCLPALGANGIMLSVIAIILAGLICHFLFYLVPGFLGVKTGYPLYVVGSSTYGTTGGILMPGLLMGLLQFGWLAVNAAIATDFILQGFGYDPAMRSDVAGGEVVFHGSTIFTVIAIVWTIAGVLMGVFGLNIIGKIASILPLFPFAMLLIAFFMTSSDIGSYEAAPLKEGAGVLLPFLGIITFIVGFFATAGAAGVDFGMGNRDKKDVQLGGLVGIAAAISFCGIFAILVVAGAHGKNPDLTSFKFDAAISEGIGGRLSKVMFFVFALSSFASACFCTFIAANSVGTMFPKIPKLASALAGGVISIILAVTGMALDLAGVFSIIGASFGPICGAMVADYLISGGKWSGPRKGINLAGYISWAVGFTVAILPMVGKEEWTWTSYITPAPVIAFVIGFVLYLALPKPPVVPYGEQAEEA